MSDEMEDRVTADDESEPSDEEVPPAKVKTDREYRYRQQAKAAEQRAEVAESHLAEQAKERALLVALATHPQRIADLDAALRLSDADAVELDDDGNPVNVGELVEALIARHPFLVSQATQPTNLPTTRPINRAKAQGTNDAVSRELAKKKYPSLRGRVP